MYVFYLFLFYLMTISVAQVMSEIKWSVNNEVKRVWMESFIT